VEPALPVLAELPPVLDCVPLPPQLAVAESAPAGARRTGRRRALALLGFMASIRESRRGAVSPSTPPSKWQKVSDVCAKR
jgi:hypothetical protein